MAGPAAGGREGLAHGEPAVDVPGRLVRGGDEGDALPHRVGDRPGQEGVVGAPEDEGVDPFLADGAQVALGDLLDLRAGRDPLLDQFDEGRAGRRRQLQVGGGGEGVVVGPRSDRRLRADDADPAVAGGGDRAAHRGLDDFDDGDPVADLVAFARVVEHGGRRGVAGDDQHLHVGPHEAVHDVQGQFADARDGLGAVRGVRGVAYVEDRLIRQLVDDGAGHGQAAHPGVEYADRPRIHRASLTAQLLVPHRSKQ